MPISPQKAAEVTARREMTEALWRCGFSNIEITQMMRVPEGIVINDKLVLGLKDKDQPQLAEDRNGAVLWTYHSSENKKLRKLLRRHPFLSELRFFAQGALMQSQDFCNVAGRLPPWCAKLLRDTWGDNHFELAFVDGNDLDFDKLVEELLKGQEALSPPKHDTALWWKRRLVGVIRTKLSKIDEMVTEFDAESMVTAVLTVLGSEPITAREKRVIEMRFGINCKSMTLEEVAPVIEVNRSRVREIEMQTLRKFRIAVHQRQIPRVTTVGDLHKEIKRLTESNEALKALAARGENGPANRKEASLYEKLDRRIDTFELSLRANNILTNPHCLDLWCVGQIAQKTDAELLKIRNFGRKSLKEVNEVILGPLGLTTGMTFPNWSPPAKNSN
jgi:hypothetical protein